MHTCCFRRPEDKKKSHQAFKYQSLLLNDWYQLHWSDIGYRYWAEMNKQQLEIWSRGYVHCAVTSPSTRTSNSASFFSAKHSAEEKLIKSSMKEKSNWLLQKQRSEAHWRDEMRHEWSERKRKEKTGWIGASFVQGGASAQERRDG